MALALKKFKAIETAEKILPFGAKLRLVKNKPFAPEEYLKFEREAEERHEFIDGKIISTFLGLLRRAASKLLYRLHNFFPSMLLARRI